MDIIRAKRDGNELTRAQIEWFISSYMDGTVADEQAAALLMAIVWRDMEPEELRTWTGAMLASGERLDLTDIGRPTVDKHSTGGVGDKVSLVLAPLVAACGAADPMLSGRGLGHTGGTLDKLEAIPGFRTQLDATEMKSVLREVGCVICAAGDSLAPADRKLYALRDVTATVESIPLIASSIMSKKIAEGTQALVLDVKVGSGAFLPDIEMARRLAATMVELGNEHDVKTTALLTAMDVPLGRAVGNALEVTESLEALQGKGPADLHEVTLACAREMLSLVGIAEDPEDALQDGRALDSFRAMVRAQGGDPEAELPRAEHVATIAAERAGYIHKLDARAVGVAAWRVGAGRTRKEDPVSGTAGVVCLKKPGEEVAEGEPVLEVHADDPARIVEVRAELESAFDISSEAQEQPPLILERIGS